MTSDDVPPEKSADVGDGGSADATVDDSSNTDAVAVDALTEAYRHLDRNHRLQTVLLYVTVFVSILYVAVLADDLVSSLTRRTLYWGLFSLVASVPFVAFGTLVRRLGADRSSLTARRDSLATRLYSPDATPTVADGSLPVDELAGVYYLAFLLFAGVGVLTLVVGLLV